jgi:hypothetical protein
MLQEDRQLSSEANQFRVQTALGPPRGSRIVWRRPPSGRLAISMRPPARVTSSLADGEAEASTGNVLAPCRIGPEERLEHLVNHPIGNAGAIVLDDNARPGAATANAHAGPHAMGRRVYDQVAQCPVEFEAAGPRSGTLVISPSGPIESYAFSRNTSGRTVRFATNTLMTVAPSAITVSQRGGSLPRAHGQAPRLEAREEPLRQIRQNGHRMGYHDQAPKAGLADTEDGSADDDSDADTDADGEDL